MKMNEKWIYCLTGLALVILVLWAQPIPGYAAAQNNGATNSAGSNAQTGNANTNDGNSSKSDEIKMMTVEGKVAQVVASGGYTYALVEKGDNKVWVAMPMSAKIVVGDEIKCPPGMIMNDFFSRSLNHTFERIVFAKSVTVTSHATDEEKAAPKKPEKWEKF